MTPDLGIEPGPHWWEATPLSVCREDQGHLKIPGRKVDVTLADLHDCKSKTCSNIRLFGIKISIEQISESKIINRKIGRLTSRYSLTRFSTLSFGIYCELF